MIFPEIMTREAQAARIRNTMIRATAFLGYMESAPSNWVKKGRIKRRRTERNCGAFSTAMDQPLGRGFTGWEMGTESEGLTE